MSDKGGEGEELACEYLQEKGFIIIERNFRYRRGEIDIIAADAETLIFIEVKTWSSFGIESLEYAIDYKKKHKIIKTSKYFLSLHRKYSYMAIRFDVIFVSPKGITHLASAFTEGV